MCGIVGMQGSGAGSAKVHAALLRLAHRGPDGSGVWRGPGIVLGHRRLAVVETSKAGAQPMVDPGGRGVLVYNGELYNDAELRRELGGVWEFRGGSDTETVLAALTVWGLAALDRLRGMFALGHYDLREGTLLLARDPLGIKPLYWTSGAEGVACASEVTALLAMGVASPRPDLVTASAYLTTIRTTLGERTLYDGVRTLEPGAWLLARDGRVERTGRSEWQGRGYEGPGATMACIEDSVRRHLRADVPTCCLLSGGLDSTIVCGVAAEHGSLSTYCAGARGPGGSEDFAVAARVAEARGYTHAEAEVTRETFLKRWPEMVRALGSPLSTPNEVAINAVAKRLRADGKVVALSGEGADELFAGYEAPLRATAAYLDSGGSDVGEFLLRESSWVPVAAKADILQPAVWEQAGQDAELTGVYRGWYGEQLELCRGDAMQAHLRLVQRTNLTGLLQRLDTAMMLEGVEGRTPLADVVVARHANGLALTDKFDAGVAGPAGTKIALRRAFAGRVPAEVLARPKASFPLPFHEWIGDAAGLLRTSAFARMLFTTAAIEAVAANPGGLWRLAWPMLNLALWGEGLVGGLGRESYSDAEHAAQAV